MNYILDITTSRNLNQSLEPLFTILVPARGNADAVHQQIRMSKTQIPETKTFTYMDSAQDTQETLWKGHIMKLSPSNSVAPIHTLSNLWFIPLTSPSFLSIIHLL